MKTTLLISSIVIVLACLPTIKADKKPKTNDVEKQIDEKSQTPAEDRQWQTRKKVTQVRHSGHAKKIHIYLSKPKTKNKKQQNKTRDDDKHADINESDFEYTTESTLHLKHSATETQTHGTPEMTTRSDGGKSRKFGESDNVGGESKHIETHHEHHEPVEKIKVKHHHHHHHHNHVKTIIKKEPVEKIVHVPVDKIVEKIVHVPKPYPVEKIVQVPVDKIVHVPKPYPVEKIVEKVIHVPKPYPVPVDRIVDRYIDRPVERIVRVPVEIEKIKHVPVEKIVEKLVHVPKPYPVVKHIHVPFEVKVPVEVEKKVPYPVEVQKKVPVPYQIEKKVPYPVKIYVPQPYPVEKPIPVPVEILKSKDSKPTYRTHSAALTALDFDKDFNGHKEHSAGSNHYQQLQQPNFFSFQSSGYDNVDQDEQTRRTKPTPVIKKKKKKNKDKFESYYKTQEQYQQQEKKEQEEKERKKLEEEQTKIQQGTEQQLQEQHKQLQEQLRHQQQQFAQLQQFSQQLMQHNMPQTQTEQWLAHVTHPSTQVEQTTVGHGSQLHTSFIHSKDPIQSASNTHEILVGPSGGGGEYYPTHVAYQLQDQPHAQGLVQDYAQSNFDYPISPYEMSPIQQEQQDQESLQQFTSYGMM